MEIFCVVKEHLVGNISFLFCIKKKLFWKVLSQVKILGWSDYANIKIFDLNEQEFTLVFSVFRVSMVEAWDAALVWEARSSTWSWLRTSWAKPSCSWNQSRALVSASTSVCSEASLAVDAALSCLTCSTCTWAKAWKLSLSLNVPGPRFTKDCD